MRVYVVLFLVPVFLCSCGDGTPEGEEKITIKVEKPVAGDDRDQDKTFAQGKDNAGNTGGQKPEKLSLEDHARVQKVLQMRETDVRESLKRDDRIRELVQKRNMIGLTLHLNTRHRKKLEELAREAEIADHKAVGFMLAKQLISQVPADEAGPSRPDRRGPRKRPGK